MKIKSFLFSVFFFLSLIGWQQAASVTSAHPLDLNPLSSTNAKGKVVFWIAPRSNIIMDGQVSGLVASLGGLIVLRASRNGPTTSYTFPAIVKRIKQYAPKTPVLSYAWVSRSTENGLIEADILRGAAVSAPLVEANDANHGHVKFLDITKAEVRGNVVSRLSTERSRLGVDGFAVDLSTRTPKLRPKPLAGLCQKQVGFCEKYSKGMDELFAKLQPALGKGGMVIYNGLWNFYPGQIEDQAKLLEHADAVAVEYFGMDTTNDKIHSFTQDILPYLNIMPRLPKNKPVLIFARGPSTYSDYLADYRWQRYLYASFLLARRDGDLFKYHAGFHIPAIGRAGGLDVYADWNVPLGDPLGPFSTQGGLYKREFSRGMVVVAPDDGSGGKIGIAGTRYNLEGNSVSGEIRLSPGDSLILFNNKLDKENNRPVSHVFSVTNIASWGWSNAELKKTPEGDRLKLAQLPAKLVGEHDLLLDYERSLAPYERLEISTKLLEPSSAVLAVAEVDDPKGKHMWVVVEISRSQDKLGKPKMREAVNFRAPPPRKGKDKLWPLIHIEYKPDDKKTILLDGSKVLNGTDYRFRRWSHVRFAGPIEVSEVSLSVPNRINMQSFN